MARVPTGITWSNFSAGLVTEATGLSYPENSVIDLSNVELEYSGLVRRRLGLAVESGGQPLSFTIGSDAPTAATVPATQVALSIHRWPSVGGDPTRNYLVVHAADTLYLLNDDLDSPTSNFSNAALNLNPTQPTAGAHLLTLQGLPLWSEEGMDGTGSVDPLKLNNVETLRAAIEGISTSPLRSVVAEGRIWFTGAGVIPFSLKYFPDEDVVLVVPIGLSEEVTFLSGPQIRLNYSRKQDYAYRDFTGIAPRIPLTQEQDSLSTSHFYNLVNQGWNAVNYRDSRSEQSDGMGGVTILNFGGWTATPADQQTISNFDGTQGVHPTLTDQVAFAKRDDGTYDYGVGRRFRPDSRAPQGRLRLYLPTGNRDWPGVVPGAAALTALPPTRANNAPAVDPYSNTTAPLNDLWFNGQFDMPQQASFTCIDFFAGRLWLGGDLNSKRPNRVYFSQVLVDPKDAGKFYQTNSPTDADFPDLLDTDGGEITISGIDRIVQLKQAGEGILVFGGNGVWFIRGGDAGFSATSFSVDRISSSGCISGDSVVVHENIVLYWSDSGIQTVDFNAGYATGAKSVTDTNIKTFHQSIPLAHKENAKGVFDPTRRKVHWVYGPGQRRTSLLTLDITTGAYTKATLPEDVASGDGNRTFIADIIPRKTASVPTLSENVFTTNGEVVTTIDGTPLVVGTNGTEFYSSLTSSLKFLTAVPVALGIDPEYNMAVTLTEFNRLDFRDAFGGIDEDYDSYIETAPILFEDVMRYKQATYVHSYFQRTEFTARVLLDGTVEPLIQSLCEIRPKWDWHITDGGNKWGDPQPAYKLRRPVAPKGPNEDVIDTGEGIVYTKRKMRGKGRALSLRYSSLPGADFQLAGFAIDGTVASD